VRDDCTVIFATPANSTATPTAAIDVMSPRALFAAAYDQFDGALTLLRGTQVLAPSAVAVEEARGMVAFGIDALRGVLVPTTPSDTKRVAHAAIQDARDAIEHLVEYRRSATEAGGLQDRVPRSRLDEAGRASLADAINVLRAATTRLV
jgi:hypothetical protein